VSRIYDALEHAKRDRMGVSPVPESPRPPMTLDRVQQSPDPDMDEEMITLYQLVTASLPLISHRVVLFVGSRSNEGTSTIARLFAMVASSKMGKSVLLIDLDRSRPDLHIYTNLKPESEIDEVLNTGSPIEKALCRIEDSSLYVMPLFQGIMQSPRTLDSAKSSGFWEPLRERFDLIVVDSPPATRFPDGPAVVSQVDGVVLVVEAEKTRWQVALSAKENIRKHGGNILGMVFNKRRYYIPDLIYRHL
jgi:protein-tyrosine kinase